MNRLKLFVPLVIFSALALLLWRGLSLDPAAMPSALIGKPVPAFYLPTVEDTDQFVNQDIFQGKVSLLNVWATWCPPCHVEHPYLVQLAEQGVHIVGVNYKDDNAAAQKWLAELHNPYTVTVVDADGRFALDLGVFGYPETYVVDKQGIIRYKHIGIVDEKVWTEILQPLIKTLE
jgi:cytochrome c biogenesis protein CcmG/thiol:disulfide interchange protein DsbE